MLGSGVPDIARILSSLLHHVEVRTLEVCAGHLRTERKLSGQLEGTDSLEVPEENEGVFIGACKGRRQTGGGSVTGMVLRCSDNVIGRTVHEVETSASVGMKVHETGHDVAVAEVMQGFPFPQRNLTVGNLRYPAVFHAQEACDDPVLQDDSAFEYHSNLIISL